MVPGAPGAGWQILLVEEVIRRGGARLTTLGRCKHPPGRGVSAGLYTVARGVWLRG